MKMKKNQLHKKANDTSLYDGPSKSLVYNSFVELFTDLIFDLRPFLNRASMTLISNWILKFLNGFWKESRSCKDGSEVKDLAERCKSRRNDLISVVSQFISGKAPAFPGDFYIVSQDPKKILDFNYYPNSFKAVINYMEEVQSILSLVELKSTPGFYVYLHKIVFHLVSSFDISEEDYHKNRVKIIILLLLPISLGQVYEHMNPTPDVMEEYGLNLLNQLRQESAEPSDEFWQLFDLVARDIHSPKSAKNRYVHDIIDAIHCFRRSPNNKYESRDYYLTAKASTSLLKIEKKKVKLNSLYSSIIESDLIKDLDSVKEFDSLIGYESGYIDPFQIPSEMNVESEAVITQMINNPGKYKPRGIHVGQNSIQDRCKYLHRVAADLLNRIKCSYMKEHYGGVRFLMKVTEPSYRHEHRNNVFVSDFSNATDTLNQTFQCKVIEEIFNSTYANFWKEISKLPKVFKHPKDNKTLEPYIQMTGQPQGLLGSFDMFSLAHIYLICMLVKRFGLERLPLEEVVAIVGDDSVISYPSELEKEPLEGYTFYEYHSWLCKEVSLIKNDSKTGKSFFDENGNYSHEVLDFAKVSILDGSFMTPIPYGLASCYMKEPGNTDLQLYFWLNSKGVTYKELVYRRIFKFYYNKPYQLMTVTSVVSSGEIPFFKNFEDQDLYSSIDSTIAGVGFYSFYLNQLEHTFLSSIMSEKDSDLLKSDNFFDECLDSLEKDFYNFQDNVATLIPLLPPNHKYNIMIKENMQIAEDIQTILSEREDREELSTLLGVLMNNDYYSLFKIMITFIDQINECIKEDDKDIWMMFCHQDFSPFKDLSDPLKEYQVKSMKKASSRHTALLKSSARKATKIISHSSVLNEMASSSISTFIDKLLLLIDISD